MGEDPAIFATALETLAMKAFGDMGHKSGSDQLEDLLRRIWNRCCAHSLQDSTNDSSHRRDSDPSDKTGTEWCVSPGGSRVMQQHGAQTWTNPFRLCSQGIYYDPTPGGDGPSAGGKRRLIREEGFASRVSGHVRPPDLGMRPQIGTEKMSDGIVPDAFTWSPYGGGALPFSGVAGRSLPVDFTVVPVLPVEGPQSVSLQVAVVRVDGTLAGDTS